MIRPGLVYGHGSGLVHGLLAGKAAERGTGVYIGGRGVRWPVVHVDDLAALYLAVVSGAAPGTIWHGISETSRLDAIAEALGNGTATSWPSDDAAKEIGSLLADLFTRDQEVLSDKTRQNLGWSPVHTSIVAYLAGSRQEAAPGTAGNAESPRGLGGGRGLAVIRRDGIARFR